MQCILVPCQPVAVVNLGTVCLSAGLLLRQLSCYDAVKRRSTCSRGSSLVLQLSLHARALSCQVLTQQLEVTAACNCTVTAHSRYAVGKCLLQYVWIAVVELLAVTLVTQCQMT
jgi:hypothetical protein